MNQASSSSPTRANEIDQRARLAVAAPRSRVDGPDGDRDTVRCAPAGRVIDQGRAVFIGRVRRRRFDWRMLERWGWIDPVTMTAGSGGGVGSGRSAANVSATRTRPAVIGRDRIRIRRDGLDRRGDRDGLRQDRVRVRRSAAWRTSAIVSSGGACVTGPAACTDVTLRDRGRIRRQTAAEHGLGGGGLRFRAYSCRYSRSRRVCDRLTGISVAFGSFIFRR